MKLRAFPLVVVLSAVTLAATPGASPAGTPEQDGNVRSDLVALSGRRVFFGHQSVGMNVLDGLRALAAEEGVPLRIVERRTAAGIDPGTVAHMFVPSNGHPLQKLESFEAAMGPASPADPDVALVKFCFVDFDPDTDVAALFARYQATLARLKAAHPRTVFVHVTVPLTTAEHGPKDLLKRILGRATSSTVNARREAFSDLLRAAYACREPLFDLARVESTTPDGHRESGIWQGHAVPALVPAYTSDGAHLNSMAARRAAAALVSVLARTHATP